IADLAGPEAGVACVLLEDLGVALCFDRRGRRLGRWFARRCRALARSFGLAHPCVDGEAAGAEILAGLRHTVRVRVFDSLGDLRGRVVLGDLAFLRRVVGGPRWWCGRLGRRRLLRRRRLAGWRRASLLAAPTADGRLGHPVLARGGTGPERLGVGQRLVSLLLRVLAPAWRRGRLLLHRMAPSRSTPTRSEMSRVSGSRATEDVRQSQLSHSLKERVALPD